MSGEDRFWVRGARAGMWGPDQFVVEGRRGRQSVIVGWYETREAAEAACVELALVDGELREEMLAQMAMNARPAATPARQRVVETAQDAWDAMVAMGIQPEIVPGKASFRPKGV